MATVTLSSCDRATYEECDGFGELPWLHEGVFPYFPLDSVRNAPWQAVKAECEREGRISRVVFADEEPGETARSG